MATILERETRGFQAEVKQLLKLMVHSLYSHREIFLRELISNASDAADKLRFEALSQPQLLADDPNLAITVDYDTKAGTVTVTDNGIGMSAMEAIKSATMVPAKYLKIDDRLGSIEKGKLADIIAVRSDPLADITTLQQVSFVMKDGVVYKQ